MKPRATTERTVPLHADVPGKNLLRRAEQPNLHVAVSSVRLRHNGGDGRPGYGSGSSRSVSRSKGFITGAGGLLADAPVDALAEQVSVPVVAGVLLDHVHEQLAQRDRLTL